MQRTLMNGISGRRRKKSEHFEHWFALDAAG